MSLFRHEQMWLVPHHVGPWSTGDLLAKSLRFHAMLAEKSIECLPIDARGFRRPADVASMAVERASQVQRFEEIQVLGLGGAEREFARLHSRGAFSKHTR